MNLAKVGLLALVFSWSTHGEVLKGKVYEAGTFMKKVLFEVRKENIKKGNLISVQTVYSYPNGGKPAVREEMVRDLNGKLVKYHFEQLQLSAWGKGEVKGNKIYYQYLSSKGEYSEAVKDVEEPLLEGSGYLDFITGNLSRLRQGEEIPSHLVIPDQNDAFSFNISLDGNVEFQGKTLDRVKVKPNSFFISIFVTPIYFYYLKGTSHLVRIVGKTFLKEKNGNSWRDIDAETIFEVPSAH